ncbi:hypothetical protein O1M63_15590 [Streptomyces mirabilis]|nr:hypothetical protein [Streptomyces mirabilis]
MAEQDVGDVLEHARGQQRVVRHQHQMGAPSSYRNKTARNAGPTR